MKRLFVLSGISLLAGLSSVAQMPSQTTVTKKTTANAVTDSSPLERVKISFPWKSGTTVSSAIVSPRDSASGLPTGKRMHKPYVITKELDRSSPLLLQAMKNHEVLPSLEIVYPGTPTDFCGDTSHLKAAQLGGGKVSMQDITIVKIQKVSPTTEEITFDYGAMTVTGTGSSVVCQEGAATSSR